MTMTEFYADTAPRRTTTTTQGVPVAFVVDDGRYTCATVRGFAVYVVGRSQRFEQYRTLIVCSSCDGTGELPDGRCDAEGCEGEGGEWIDDPFGDGEWVDDPDGQLWVAMVGDGGLIAADVADLAPLDDDAYCSGCGQIGCGWC